MEPVTQFHLPDDQAAFAALTIARLCRPLTMNIHTFHSREA